MRNYNGSLKRAFHAGLQMRRTVLRINSIYLSTKQAVYVKSLILKKFYCPISPATTNLISFSRGQ